VAYASTGKKKIDPATGIGYAFKETKKLAAKNAPSNIT